MKQRPLLLVRARSSHPSFRLTCLCVLLVALSLFGSACTRSTPGVADSVASPKLAKAESMFQSRNYTGAMLECVDLSRQDPLMPGLAELQARVMQSLTDERARVIAQQRAGTVRRMQLDIDRQETVPNTYGLQRNVKGLTGSLRSAPSKMQQILDKKVTVHLDGVTLSDFIMAVGATEGINIIADDSLSAGGAAAEGAEGAPPKTLTLHAEEVPLSEILDYISRNLGVKLYLGDNALWVTAGEPKAEDTVPMETRMYRLRKGLSSDELGTTNAAGSISIIDAINRFVPAETGSDILFDKKTHLLISRNTRQNLARIERLIDEMDVCPPQILIEARFISTGISDLRELGIDWILNSPVALTKKTVIRDGSQTLANEIQVDPTSPTPIVGFTGFPNSAQGLNMAVQGLLTDPMFRAVIHALETSGNSRTLSVPKVTTVNNRPAQIRIGEDFRYFDNYDIQSVPTSVTDSGSQVYSTILVPVGTPQLEQLGIQLDVTPSVGADLTSVNLHIVPEISEFVRYESYEVAAGNSSTTTTTTGGTNSTSLVKLPIFRRSKIETELIVQSGETVVMGGLISSSQVQTERGVPILSWIPLIGRLFRSEGVENTRQNLLIFVTASILSERGETLIPMDAGPEAGAAN